MFLYSVTGSGSAATFAARLARVADAAAAAPDAIAWDFEGAAAAEGSFVAFFGGFEVWGRGKVVVKKRGVEIELRTGRVVLIDAARQGSVLKDIVTVNGG